MQQFYQPLADLVLSFHAPIDLIAANGARNKHVYIVPSLNLVVTRIGDRVDEEFAKGFWQLLGEAARP
jgi:hypothetical protein